MTLPSPHTALVNVPVTVLWRTPDSPRGADAPMLAETPDNARWLAAMDAPGVDRADSRFGLFDRIESQLVEGEPVTVLEQDEEWSRIVAPWQPSHHDERGYPGVVRTAHLRPGEPGPAPQAAVTLDPQALLASARTHIGIRYLWGGTHESALDCSGIVHLVCREYGALVPRDADDQHEVLAPVELGSEQPGDLYFFAYEGKRTHHVGFVTGGGAMLHASGTGSGVVEEPMPPDRATTLVGVGRLPGVTPS